MTDTPETEEQISKADAFRIPPAQLQSFTACIADIAEDQLGAAPKASMGDLVNLMQTHAPQEPEIEKKRSYGVILCEKEFAKQRAEDDERKA